MYVVCDKNNCGTSYMEGTILRRWKRNWFDLWADGRLVFYNDKQRRDMEDDIHMRVDCINIRNSSACQGTCYHGTLMSWSNLMDELTFIEHLKYVASLFVLLRHFRRAEPTGGKDA